MNAPILRRQSIRVPYDAKGPQRTRMRPQPPEGMNLFSCVLTIEPDRYLVWSGGGRLWGTVLPSFWLSRVTFLQWQPVVAMPEKTDDGWFWVYEIKVEGL